MSQADHPTSPQAKPALPAASDTTTTQAYLLKMHFEENDDDIKARAKAYFAVSQQHAAEAEAKLQECAKHLQTEGKCSDHMRAALDKWSRSVNDFEMVANEYGAAFHDRVADYVKQQRQAIADMAQCACEPKCRPAP